MSRSLRAFLPVAGATDALREVFADDPSTWLPNARRAGGPLWQVRLRGAGVERDVRLEIGSPWRSGATAWRSISWDPAGDDGATVDRLLPSFDGELGLHDASGHATLLLDGRYDPPGGGLGSALDALGLQRVARGTVERLLAEIGAQLSSAALLART
ncbi:hypothetical protein FTX61_08580 [Nitriliruptoraceae bacterium ZYF776]|nr:hypothetical protein [Profundirhabdus halotolerans]